MSLPSPCVTNYYLIVLVLFVVLCKLTLIRKYTFHESRLFKAHKLDY